MSLAAKSAYECEREKRIEANNAVLKSLGLDDKPILVDKRQKKAPAQKKTKYEDDPEYVVPKRETRSAGRSVVKYSEASSDDDGDGLADIPRPVKVTKTRPVAAAAGASDVNILDEPSDVMDKCVVVEEAKTSRSKCRKCLEMLTAGALRVGMESWIVGRNVMTWQHPECFCSGLEVTMEVSGRGKCKQTKMKFEAGERRLSASAHTTVNNFKLSAAASLLRPVFRALSGAASDRRKAFDGIARLSDLQPAERALLATALASDDETAVKAEKDCTQSTVADEVQSEPSTDASTKQPAAGQVSKASGRVCWRFAGCLCYGTLLPAQESASTCYARTHKGNTKVLTKGNSSWWMLD
jgi:hypothetical protein